MTQAGSGTGAAAPGADVRALVARAQGGDHEALEELYLLHFDRVYSYLQLTVGNRHDAEDLTNQTFVKMLESIERFQWRKAPFSAWLFRIAHNLAIDHFRSRRRWQPEEEPPEPLDADHRSAETKRCTRSGAEHADDDRDLSEDQQHVLTLKFVFNFSNGEAATILGKSGGREVAPAQSARLAPASVAGTA